ncbi:odorant receptor 10-like [Megalopta genalis]|uniref:odorant receptor 10-like n=1 Tax=Megalopta genalis TaxID=115081 RepID=UPI003FD4BFAD
MTIHSAKVSDSRCYVEGRPKLIFSSTPSLKHQVVERTWIITISSQQSNENIIVAFIRRGSKDAIAAVDLHANNIVRMLATSFLELDTLENDLSENLYKTAAFAVHCYKLASMLAMRENMGVLMDTLESEPFAPVGDEELEIRRKFDKSAEKIVKVYTTVLETWTVWTVLVTLLMNFTSRKLLYRVWLPFEYTSATIYSLVYLHHTLVTVVCVTLTAAYDSLFAGLLVHIYSQFEILRHRLQNVHRNENDSVKLCALHHDQIYKFANMVNNEFKSVTFMQFVESTAVLCFSLYQLTLSELNGSLADVALYVTCTLLQILYFCWFGNEIKLKSLEVPNMIFESEWTSLSTKTKKILLMMMNRATVPIEFTSIHIVTVNLETFKTLVKTAYSVFNLLQQNQ